MPRNSFWSWSVITNYWRNGTWNWSKIIQFWQNWKSNNNKTKISKVFIQYLLTNSSYTYRVVKKKCCWWDIYNCLQHICLLHAYPLHGVLLSDRKGLNVLLRPDLAWVQIHTLLANWPISYSFWNEISLLFIN